MFKPGSDYLARINKVVAEKVAAQPDTFFGPVEVKDCDKFYFDGKVLKDGDKFYFDGKVLVVTYAPYEVAPYAAGVVSFIVPADSLSDILVY